MGGIMRGRVLQVLSAVVMVALFAGIAVAQEGETHQVASKSWFDLFKSTGLVGILLVLTSLIGTALLIQFMVNMSESKLSNPALMSEVEALITEGNVDEAFALAEQDRSYSGKVLAGALS